MEAMDSPQHPRLTVTRIIATALAAVTATLLASSLGVYGTVIGAAVVSVAITIGVDVYERSLRRTREMLTVDRFGRVEVEGSDLDPTFAAASGRRLSSRWLAGGAGALFIGLLLVVTLTELVIGKPLSSLWHHDASRATTVGSVVDPRRNSQVTTPPSSIVTVTPTPSVTVTAPVPTPTVTVTPQPTVTVTVTATPTPASTNSPVAPTSTPTPAASAPAPAASGQAEAATIRQ
jgi:hypothetical protein